MHPLEDPRYDPVHKPQEGRVPPVIERWGPASQLRWFRRFGGELNPMEDLGAYWCTSEEHPGPCCISCQWEAYEDTGVVMDGYCCCQDQRGKWRA